MARTKEETQKIQERFLEHFKDALSKTWEIVEERGKGYNVNIAIPDYFPDGIRDIMYEVHKKTLRVRNLMNAPDGHEADGPLTDSLLDSIAYLGFAYAWERCKKEGLL